MSGILITGATGFIGSFLVKALIKKNKVMALVRKDSDISQIKRLDIKIIRGDLNDVTSLDKATKGIDIVIHCAALHGNFTYKQLHEVNAVGTKKLLEACVKNKIKRFIHFSTAAVMGNVMGGNEKTECNPHNEYGKTKLEGELIVKEYMKKRFFPITIIRPPLVYGPSKKSNMIKWFKYIKKGYFLIFGKGNNLIDVIYIDDLVRATLLILKDKKSENKLYIVSGQTVTMNEFVNEIAKAGGKRKPIPIPVWLAYTAGFIIEIFSKILGIEPKLSRLNVKNMTRSRSLDMSKIKKELGYRPKMGVKEGIRRTIAII